MRARAHARRDSGGRRCAPDPENHVVAPGSSPCTRGTPKPPGAVMHVKSLASWAALVALAAAPVAFADNDKDKDKKSDEATKDKDRDRASDEATQKTTEKRAKLVDGDLQVIAHQHHLDQMEVDLGKLAQRKGTTAGVKDYG